MIKLLVLASISFFNPSIQKDSIGVEIINGKTFVVHKVIQGETLYSISKRYGVTVDQILEYNPTADSGLEINQILKVPYVPRPKQPQGMVHKVAEKETLYSISKLYGVSVEEIKQWNNLSDTDLTVGRELVIKKKNTVVVTNAPQTIKTGKGVHTVAAKETLFSISKQYGITREQLREWNGLQTDELKIGQVLVVVQPVYNVTVAPVETKTQPVVQEVKQTDAPEKIETIRISENPRGSDEIVESGLAELIEGTEGNRKYLALHRTAPVGSILKVRNEMNNREVFVRVMGKLQDTALTDKIIIRISKSAYDRLGAIDPKFRVEVTYSK